MEVLALRLRDLDWRSWEPAERGAVADLLRALWEHVLAAPTGWPVPGLAPDVTVDTALCALGCADDDLAPYLGRWSALLAVPLPSAVSQLHAFVTRHVRRGPTGLIPDNAFWGAEGGGTVSAWLAGAALADTVAAAFEGGRDERTLEWLTEIDTCLSAR